MTQSANHLSPERHWSPSQTVRVLSDRQMHHGRRLGRNWTAELTAGRLAAVRWQWRLYFPQSRTLCRRFLAADQWDVLRFSSGVLSSRRSGCKAVRCLLGAPWRKEWRMHIQRLQQERKAQTFRTAKAMQLYTQFYTPLTRVQKFPSASASDKHTPQAATKVQGSFWLALSVLWTVIIKAPQIFFYTASKWHSAPWPNCRDSS